MTLPDLCLSILGRKKGPGPTGGSEPPEDESQAVWICCRERERSLSPRNGIGLVTDLNSRFSQERT